jgi:hypothetical protein
MVTFFARGLGCDDGYLMGAVIDDTEFPDQDIPIFLFPFAFACTEGKCGDTTDTIHGFYDLADL